MWKICKVVMLPTNEKALFYIDKVIGLVKAPQDRTIPKLNYQHLSFISDEEIKKGDWMYSKMDGYPTQWDGDLSETKNPKEYGYNKIISTTDTSLFYTEQGILNHLTREQDVLPKLPQSFIEKYISEYNRGNVITKVLIEYNSNIYPITEELIEATKIYSDNTINIKLIKDNWSREEVIDLCTSSYAMGVDKNPLFYNWIEDIL